MTNIKSSKQSVRPTLEIGVFGSIEDARKAVHDLVASGFTKDHISVLCSDEAKERNFREFEHQEPAGTHASAAAIAGGTIGAI
ncbi:MAG TPA: general stress protein, partial [Lacipirellulaceae bacterium]|nr:general stress protein [Lacipirellulaceae bacterium]